MSQWYKADLAYIHHVGFGDYALQSAPGILSMLAQQGLHQGLIVDLGCGSGLSVREFVQAGYQVLGIDISAEMVAIARQQVPAAEFRIESLLKADLPTCVAVTAIGEVLNYLFDPDTTPPALSRLFQRIYQALIPGGLVIFDIAQPGQVGPGQVVKGFTEGKDWIVLVEKSETPDQVLTRRIITFREVAGIYQRNDETHQQQLYNAEALADVLSQIGFEPEIMSRYGRFELPPQHAVIVATKPGAGQ